MPSDNIETVSVDENESADEIAQHITKLLVDAFEAKENRKPTAEEVQELLEEMTEERIALLMGEIVGDAEDESASSDEECSDDEESDDKDDEVTENQSDNIKEDVAIAVNPVKMAFEKDDATVENVCGESKDSDAKRHIDDVVMPAMNEEKRVRVE